MIVTEAGDALCLVLNETEKRTTFVFETIPRTSNLKSSKGEDMASVMNAVGFDAMTVGNHEFDFGLHQLRRLSKQTISQSSHLTYM